MPIKNSIFLCANLRAKNFSIVQPYYSLLKRNGVLEYKKIYNILCLSFSNYMLNQRFLLIIEPVSLVSDHLMRYLVDLINF